MDGFFVGEVLGTVARPPTRYTPQQGKSFVALTVLVEKTGQYASKSYVDVALWGKLADDWENNLPEGTTVLIRGDLRSRKRTKDGVDYYTFTLSPHMDGVTVFDQRSDTNAGQQTSLGDDNIPF